MKRIVQFKLETLYNGDTTSVNLPVGVPVSVPVCQRGLNVVCLKLLVPQETQAFSHSVQSRSGVKDAVGREKASAASSCNKTVAIATAVVYNSSSWSSSELFQSSLELLALVPAASLSVDEADWLWSPVTF